MFKNSFFLENFLVNNLFFFKYISKLGLRTKRFLFLFMLGVLKRLGKKVFIQKCLRINRNTIKFVLNKL